MTEEMKQNMKDEAMERMRLLEISERIICLFENDMLTEALVDHENLTVRETMPLEEDLEIVRKVQEKYGILVYFIIKDKGIWPDGCTFDRYTLPYVSKSEDEYEMEKTDCIGRCGTLPAYVYNAEEPECSEITEFRFGKLGGLIINIS